VEKSLMEMKLEKHGNCFMARSNAPIVVSWGIEKHNPKCSLNGTKKRQVSSMHQILYSHMTNLMTLLFARRGSQGQIEPRDGS
jgi:hypothetical protein